jgi:hypothetical protein
MKPKNPQLYELAKSIVYPRYSKPSAYRSGALQKKYKELGGTYIDDGKEKTLARWFKEEWKDVNPKKTETSYPVYRPTIRVNDKTPLTVNEIDKKDLIKKSKQKQIIKGAKNLAPFKKQ